MEAPKKSSAIREKSIIPKAVSGIISGRISGFFVVLHSPEKRTEPPIAGGSATNLGCGFPASFPEVSIFDEFPQDPFQTVIVKDPHGLDRFAGAFDPEDLFLCGKIPGCSIEIGGIMDPADQHVLV